MIELRGEEAAIAAPAVQEEYVRITRSRNVERKPGCVRLSACPGARFFDLGHGILLGSGWCSGP